MKKKDKHKQRIMKKPEEQKDISFLLGFGLTALFLCFCLLVLPVRYETNDELANIQRLVVKGDIAPEATSPVLSQTLGHGLIFLYKTVPEVPWYGITLYTALYLGISLIYSVFIRCSGKFYIIFFSPFFMLYVFHCFSFVSFTAAALIVELGAFLSLLEWSIKEKSPYNKNLLYACLITVGLAMGYMLRWELALWFSAFGIPVLLFAKKYQLKKALPFALALIAFVLADRAMAYYSTIEEEKNYLVYNELRRVFHDTEKGAFHKDVTPAALKKVGWTLNDYSMFRSWILYDQSLFNTDTLKLFLNENSFSKNRLTINSIGRKLNESYLKSKNYTLVFICAVLAILLFYFPVIKNKPGAEIVRGGLSLGFIFSMILFFAYYRFSPRVYIPIYIFSIALVFLMVNISSPTKKEKGKNPSFLQVAVSIAALFLIFFAYEKAWAKVVTMNQTLQYSLIEKTYVLNCLNNVKTNMDGIEPVIILMNPTDALGSEKAHPLEELSDYKDLVISPSGTSINSPRYYRFLDTLNLSSGKAFLNWSINNKQALFVFIVRNKKFHRNYVHMWEAYYNHRISPKRKVKFEPVYDFRRKNGYGPLFYQMKFI